nr:MAG TPA: hypothetical protein [Caudoviricetes sp.]
MYDSCDYISNCICINVHCDYVVVDRIVWSWVRGCVSVILRDGDFLCCSCCI